MLLAVLIGPIVKDKGFKSPLAHYCCFLTVLSTLLTGENLQHVPRNGEAMRGYGDAAGAG
jgi:hypothetical protein